MPPGHAIDALARICTHAMDGRRLTRLGGTVSEISASHFRADGLQHFVRLGDLVTTGRPEREDYGEVIRIAAGGAIVKPFHTSPDMGIGTRVWRAGTLTLRPHEAWAGRIINPLGKPIDGLGDVPQGKDALPLDRSPPPAMHRARVSSPVPTGITAIDVFTPLCAGQRTGIFAGSGVGKSTLLGMLAQAPGFDVTVAALIGERGREVREFVEDVLGQARHRCVTVAATGDESAMMRRLAIKAALTVAEFFRDRGLRVLLLVDSVTRHAHAEREAALAAGEPAVARGYPPSVFSTLPCLLERAGPGGENGGSITGIFAVLVDGDDHNDPVADAVRGTLDGHIVLDRAIADQGRYPAINILSSISRLAHHVWTPDQAKLVLALRGMTARYEESRDLRLMGGYQPGADPAVDHAVALTPKLYDALRQTPDTPPAANAFQHIASSISPA